VPQSWRNDALAAKWNKIRDLRRVVTGALELERANKRIGASLQAHPKIFANGAYVDALNGIDLAEISITSAATLQPGAAPGGAFTLSDVPDVGVVVELADGEKCERCWRVLPDVGSHGHPGVCGRCDEALGPHPASE
jgi:isoleucyl-tRNA synthetase